MFIRKPRRTLPSHGLPRDVDFNIDLSISYKCILDTESRIHIAVEVYFYSWSEEDDICSLTYV